MPSIRARLGPSANVDREAEEGRASPAFPAQASQGGEPQVQEPLPQEPPAQESQEPPQPSPLSTASYFSARSRMRESRGEDPRLVEKSQKNEQSKAALLVALRALGAPDASALLICWGPPGHCHIVSTLIRDGWGPTDQWKEARRVWDTTRRNWKSWLPWYGLKDVRVVEINIAGPLPQAPDAFLGIYRRGTLDEKAAFLQSLEQEYPKEDFGCEYEPSIDRWNHDMQCPAYTEEYVSYGFCPYEEHQKNWADLRRLRRRPFLKMLFCNPELAEFSEPMDDTGLQLLIPQRKLLGYMSASYCPTIGDLSFTGLLIQEGWLLTRPWMVLSSIAGSTLAISVTLGWLVYGDWAVAWNVGACFLTLCAAICTGVYRAAEPEVS